MPFHHSAPIQSRPGKGKGPLHPETTKSRLLHISPPKDRPHEPTKVYKDCRDRILDRRTDPIPINVKPKDSRVKHLGPPPKPTHIPAREAPAHPYTRPSAPETLPHADPAMRLLFEKVRRLESEQQCNHQPLWAKP
ncbi:unnamed protein product [Prunus brigantina]